MALKANREGKIYLKSCELVIYVSKRDFEDPK